MRPSSGQACIAWELPEPGRARVDLGRKIAGKPDAGNPHVRFEEGGGRWRARRRIMRHTNGKPRNRVGRYLNSTPRSSTLQKQQTAFTIKHKRRLGEGLLSPLLLFSASPRLCDSNVFSCLVRETKGPAMARKNV